MLRERAAVLRWKTECKSLGGAEFRRAFIFDPNSSAPTIMLDSCMYSFFCTFNLGNLPLITLLKSPFCNLPSKSRINSAFGGEMLEFFLVIILFCGQNFAARNTITPDWRMVPMAGNEIVKNETVELDDEQGGTIIAINLALDIHDLSQAEPFVAEVAEAFLMQRMVSPPETSGLLITIVGKMQPDEFATFWSLATADNEPLQVFMSQMVFADVVGKMRDREPDEMFGVSLLQQ